MSVYNERINVTDANYHTVVQAQFEPGGKPYHYFCPGAEVGDIIQAPGNSRATVIALAANLAPGATLRYAKIIERNSHAMNEHAKSHTHTLAGGMTAEDHEAEAKRLRKSAKAARKAQRAREAAESENARLRQLAIDTLAEVAEHGGAPSRITAARALLDVLS